MGSSNGQEGIITVPFVLELAWTTVVGVLSVFLSPDDCDIFVNDR